MAKVVKKGRPSKRSLAMKEVWARKKAAKEVKVTNEAEPKMKVRVISHQDEIRMDNYEINTLGELFDILTGNYLGIRIYEVQIQMNSTAL